jgi:hypothetical protein
MPQAHGNVVVERVAEHQEKVDDRGQHEDERRPPPTQPDVGAPGTSRARRVQELAWKRDCAIGRWRSVVLHRAPPAGPFRR